MRELHGDDSTVREQSLHPGNEVVDVRNVRQDIIPEEQISFAAFRDEPTRQVLSEELRYTRNSFLDRGLGDVFSRFDPKHGNAVGKEILKKIAIIAGQLYDERMIAQLQSSGNAGDIFSRML